MKRRASDLLIGIVVAFVLAPGLAMADEGMPVQFHSLVQQGFGVDITLKYYSFSGDPVGTYSLLLRRVDLDGTHVLIDNAQLAAGDVVEISDPWCWDGEDEEYCQTVDWCTDCDGDETPECMGMCAYTQYYAWPDECVPPGVAQYLLQAEGGEWPFSDEIDVLDVGQECESATDSDVDSDADSDADADSDSDSDADAEGDSGSCSVSGVGSNAGTGLSVAVIMGLLGFCAFAFGRGRS